jgi:hypothetical protein
LHQAVRLANSERFIDGRPAPVLKVRMKARFNDRHEQRDYLKVEALAGQLLADPGMAGPARDHVRAHLASDPHQAPYAAS